MKERGGKKRKRKREREEKKREKNIFIYLWMDVNLIYIGSYMLVFFCIILFSLFTLFRYILGKNFSFLLYICTSSSLFFSLLFYKKKKPFFFLSV